MYGWSIKTETLILSILTFISFILSIVAVIISNNIYQTSTTITTTIAHPPLSTKSLLINNDDKKPVFNNDDIILETKSNWWKFVESKNGGLCFYATKKSDNVNTNKSCIEIVNNTKELNLINFAN